MTHHRVSQAARARDILAAQYEADDMPHIAYMLRSGGHGHVAAETAIRAMLVLEADTRKLCADAAERVTVKIAQRYGDYPLGEQLAEVATAIRALSRTSEEEV